MPKDNLKILVTNKDEVKADVKEILQEALKANYDGVLVVGLKDGQVYRNVSKLKSVIEAVGLLELAKRQLLDTW